MAKLARCQRDGVKLGSFECPEHRGRDAGQQLQRVRVIRLERVVRIGGAERDHAKQAPLVEHRRRKGRLCTVPSTRVTRPYSFW